MDLGSNWHGLCFPRQFHHKGISSRKTVPGQQKNTPVAPPSVMEWRMRYLASLFNKSLFYKYPSLSILQSISQIAREVSQCSRWIMMTRELLWNALASPSLLAGNARYSFTLLFSGTAKSKQAWKLERKDPSHHPANVHSTKPRVPSAPEALNMQYSNPKLSTSFKAQKARLNKGTTSFFLWSLLWWL